MGTLGLFEGYGIEIEYMIVDRDTLRPKPISDHLLRDAEGAVQLEVCRGPLCWSNELVLHVIELKTNGPTRDLAAASRAFQADVLLIDELLAPRGATLMPTAMHPFMDPHEDTVLWPHEQNDIYSTYDRIFDCRGHGWSNLQSQHLNLPFANDEEFARLHTAIRAILPLLPALAASSPFADGKPTGNLDTRMVVYRDNSRRVPSVTGAVVPEPIVSAADYEHTVLEPMYAEIAPHDPEGILQYEWLNARGAIARFDRNAIEIRVLDTQECPLGDLAVAAAVASVLEALSDPELTDHVSLLKLDTVRLAQVLELCNQQGDQATIDYPEYSRALGLPAGPQSARDVWLALTEAHPPTDPSFGRAIRQIVETGPLARRMLRRTGNQPSRAALVDLCQELCSCLHDGRLFEA